MRRANFLEILRLSLLLPILMMLKRRRFIHVRMKNCFIILALYTFWSVMSGQRRTFLLTCTGATGLYVWSECCKGGKPMAARRLNVILKPSHNAEQESGHAARTVFQAFGMTPPRMETSLPVPVSHAQPTVPLIW